jgi:hypothetical protein
LSQVRDLWQRAGSGELTVSQAQSEFNQIKSTYMQSANAIKDSKTRNNAILWWNNDVEPFYLPRIIQSAQDWETRHAWADKFVPTFAGGGGYWSQRASSTAASKYMGLVPGIYDRKDDKLARVSGNEVILTPDVWGPIAPYLKARRVPGFAAGGGVWSQPNSTTPTADATAGAMAPIVIKQVTVIVDALGRAVKVAMASEEGRDIIIEQVETHIDKTGTAGLMGTIELELAKRNG